MFEICCPSTVGGKLNHIYRGKKTITIDFCFDCGAGTISGKNYYSNYGKVAEELGKKRSTW